MSISLTPFTKQQLMPQEKLEVENTEANFYWFTQRNQSSRTPYLLTPDAVNSLTCHGHRVMIESGAGESSSYSDKEYSDAGAEVTKDTKKWCPMILKVEPLH
jgi:alanine dehydrogenase